MAEKRIKNSSNGQKKRRKITALIFISLLFLSYAFLFCEIAEKDVDNLKIRHQFSTQTNSLVIEQST
jgi:hypothetical protein